MPFVRSLVSKHCTYIIAMILSLGEIMPIYSYYAEKKLIYIIITAPSNRQFFLVLNVPNQIYVCLTILNQYLTLNIYLNFLIILIVYPNC